MKDKFRAKRHLRFTTSENFLTIANLTILTRL